MLLRYPLLLKAPLTAFTFLVGAAGFRAEAITVDVDNVAWPEAAEVITSTEVGQFSFHDDTNSGDPFTLSQTFQVPSQFDLNSIYINYENEGDAATSLGLQIFEVTDFAASPLTATPAPGDILLDTTFDAPVASSNTVMQIFLDAPLTIPANAGTAGYALRFTTDGTRDFGWDRTGGAGSVYAFGKAFENGTEKSGGERDFSLALSVEGPPPPPVEVFSVQNGDANTGTTWDTGQPPAAGFNYNVVSPHTVTFNSTAFAG